VYSRETQPKVLAIADEDDDGVMKVVDEPSATLQMECDHEFFYLLFP
jgi:hypothetical protein